MPVTPRVQVTNWREFNRSVSKAVDRELPKRIGQVHKDIGKMVISRLEPQPRPSAVGSGAGAAVRPSAARREVQLRVGGAHRAGGSADEVRKKQWGRLRIYSPSPPPRPHLIGTALKHQDKIEDMLLTGVEKALKASFRGGPL